VQPKWLGAIFVHEASDSHSNPIIQLYKSIVASKLGEEHFGHASIIVINHRDIVPDIFLRDESYFPQPQ